MLYVSNVSGNYVDVKDTADGVTERVHWGTAVNIFNNGVKILGRLDNKFIVYKGCKYYCNLINYYQSRFSTEGWNDKNKQSFKELLNLIPRGISMEVFYTYKGECSGQSYTVSDNFAHNWDGSWSYISNNNIVRTHTDNHNKICMGYFLLAGMSENFGCIVREIDRC